MKKFCLFLIYLFIFTFFSACQGVKSNQTDKSSPPEKKVISPEQKAIKLAEEFIAQNGYTNKPADKENLSYESIEWAKNTDELLKQRYDSLEPKAYGYSKGAKGRKGWTVAFRYSESWRKESESTSKKKKDEIGRAVTMNENFENLQVEHVDFILKFAKKIDTKKTK